MIVFGPVPSRRLGQSLGINNIPPKHCTYSCIYCQLGKTPRRVIERTRFYDPEEIARQVEARLEAAEKKAEAIDILTLVPDGEPTLDLNLGRTIGLLKGLGKRIGAISNASLLWREDVRTDLEGLDWISLKIDTASQEVWQRVNRPHPDLKLDQVLEGVADFSHHFRGELVTETMLVKDINTAADGLAKAASFIAGLAPQTSYLSVPTRPPAERIVAVPPEEMVNTAYHTFAERSLAVECLLGYEGNAFAFTGNVEEDLLSITAVHPMRADAVDILLAKAGSDWAVVEKLIDDGRMVELTYRGRRFYMRRLCAPR